MFGHKKSPLRLGKHKSVDPIPSSASKNPFDSDDEIDSKPKRTSSDPTLSDPKAALFEHSHGQSHGHGPSQDHGKYRNDFRESGGFENQSVQELEGYAVYKSEETTKTVNSCLKIAEDIREDASKTLVMLHHQGEQITRTHAAAADIEHDLSRGEKLLGSLGGMFSKTWKPKKTRNITGPIITRGYADEAQRRADHMDQREKLGLAPNHKAHSRTHHHTVHSEPTDDPYQKVEVEKVKQEDALSDLSNLLGELKDMAVDMGTEIDRHIGAIDHTYGDVDEVAERVQGANRRGRHLLGK